jgi:hypothetical protein
VIIRGIFDRLPHRTHVLNIKGRSQRLRDLEQALYTQRPRPGSGTETS